MSIKKLRTAALAALLTLAPAVKAGPFQELTTDQLFEYIWQDFSFYWSKDPHPAIGRILVCFRKDSDPMDKYCPVSEEEFRLMQKHAEKEQAAYPEADEGTGI